MVDEQSTSTTKARHRPHQATARPHTISIRLSDEERDCVRAAAAETGLTATGYVATAALAAATRQGPASVEDLRDLQRSLFAVRRAVNELAGVVVQAATATSAVGEVPDWADGTVQSCRSALACLDQVIVSVDTRLR
jgi:hypothetical protein